MTQREFTTLSKRFSPAIASRVKSLEKEFEKYFLVVRKVKKSEYRMGKKLLLGIIINTCIPLVIDELDYEIKLQLKKLKSKKDNK